MKFSMVFPGQGSQSPGMGRFLFDQFKSAHHIFEEASDSIQVDLKKLCFEGPEEKLNLTENTQPALLTVSTATAEVLKSEFNIHTHYTAGHSIGEYASFVQAQVMKFSDAVKAVQFRGQSMQSAVPVGQGGMLAVLGLDETQTLFMCQYAVQKSGLGPLSPANYNCDGQIVISGNLQTIHWLKDHFKPEIFTENGLPEPRRAKLIPLAVSAPFHCEMMKPAEEKMADFLNRLEFKNAITPIIQNFTARAETDALELKKNLIFQVSGPVRWTQSMIELKNLGQTQIIETGHGSVLKGLLKKINPDFNVFSTNSIDDLKLIEAALK